MNVFVAAVVYILTITLIGFSIYENPVDLGLGLALFLAGIPIFYATKYLKSNKSAVKVISECK